MREIEVREVTEIITVPSVMGARMNKPIKYLKLYFCDSGLEVSDGVYTLMQFERCESCNVTHGKAFGVEWVASDKPLFMIIN